MPQGAVASCTNHPEREAIGVCVQCRTRVCSECSTKVEGINYCVNCLAGLAIEGGRARASRAPGSPLSWGVYAQASSLFAVLSVLMWLFLEAVMPGG
jgi:hypothetical protein